MNYTSQEIIGGLLAGGATLFGKRVEVAWPDGLPEGMDDELLRSIGQHWVSAALFPQWIRADADFCKVMVQCGKELAGGKCDRHGQRT